MGREIKIHVNAKIKKCKCMDGKIKKERKKRQKEVGKKRNTFGKSIQADAKVHKVA